MPHTEDIEAHIKSIYEDTEYWGGKRLQSRIFRLIRKGKLSFYEFIQASNEALQHPSVFDSSAKSEHVEDLIAALEFRLGDLIKGITISTTIIRDFLPVEEYREESGSYDPSFKFEHRHLEGTVDERLSQLSARLTEYQTLLEVLQRVIINRGIIREARLREMLAANVPPRYENGAHIVAKAWTDSDFKAKLLSDAKTTLREMDFALNRTPKLVVVEDTDKVHNVIVCTLCSCYPYELLGNPPWWYKSDEYREPIIKNPRQVLSQMFKLAIPDSIEIRVHDSTSDIRYMVLPKRPEGTETMKEEELSRLVTEESLIGVGEMKRPSAMALSI